MPTFDSDDIDLVVDGNSLYARAWFAVRAPKSDLFDDPNGTLIAAVASLAYMIHPDYTRLPGVPTRMLVAWDGDERKTDKRRNPKPEGWHEGIEQLGGLIKDLFGAASVRSDGEADDLVARVALWQEKRGRSVVIASADKDLFQLEGGRIACYDLDRKKILSRDDILRRFPVKRPSQIAIYLAVLGDYIDGIDGLPKYGKVKTARLFDRVTKDMSMQEAVRCVLEQIPASLHPVFYECLDKTLLWSESETKKPPSPREIVIAPTKALLGTPVHSLARLWRGLNAKQPKPIL